MCLLVLAWMSHPRYRLVVAANRDEFHERPTAPLAWWSDATGILAGRDLTAGGTWLGVTRKGRFGAVTNFRDFDSLPASDAPSRGGLVPQFLVGDETPKQFVARVGPGAARFAGFNLLAAGTRSLYYLSNRAVASPRELAPGVYGLSNHELDRPWPKLVRARSRFAAALDDDEPDAAALFDVLSDSESADDPAQFDTGLPPGLARAMSSPFVRHPRYGTRCSTVLMTDRDGRTVIEERRFDSEGRQTGATRMEFTCEDQNE